MPLTSLRSFCLLSFWSDSKSETVMVFDGQCVSMAFAELAKTTHYCSMNTSAHSNVIAFSRQIPILRAERACMKRTSVWPASATFLEFSKFENALSCALWLLSRWDAAEILILQSRYGNRSEDGEGMPALERSEDEEGASTLGRYYTVLHETRPKSCLASAAVVIFHTLLPRVSSYYKIETLMPWLSNIVEHDIDGGIVIRWTFRYNEFPLRFYLLNLK